MLSSFRSIVYKRIGFALPFTVTRSMFLQNLCSSGVIISYRSSLIRILTPNCLVAAYNLDAILTLGLRYEASILYSEPMAPSIAHPICRPNPIFT